MSILGELSQFITDALTVTRAGSIYSPPEPPVPPGPYDDLVPSVNGLEAYSKQFTVTAGHQGTIFRVIFRNNTSGTPFTYTVQVDGINAELGASCCSSNLGGSGAMIYGIRGLAAGTHTLTITKIGGSAGMAAVRIGEITTMPANWNTGASIASFNDQHIYYIDDSLNFNASGNLVSTQAGWMDAAAYPIRNTFDDTEQWSTEQTPSLSGMAAYFGYGISPIGEQWGGELTNRGFVAYSGNGQDLENPVMVVLEMVGCVL